MIYALFLLSVVLYIYLSALDIHLKYFHKFKEKEGFLSILTAPRRFFFLSRLRPDWILYNKNFFWHQIGIESLLFFLLPFLVVTGFYSVVQFYFNLIDNLDYREMSVTQMDETIDMIKKRIAPYLFLNSWLLPFGIFIVILVAIFPFLKTAKLDERFSKFRKLIFKTYYFISFFSIFTFWTSNEVSRQNGTILNLAVRITTNNEEGKNLNFRAKKAYSRKVAQTIQEVPQIDSILNESESLHKKSVLVQPEQQNNDDREAAANAFNLVVKSLSSTANYWESFQIQAENLPDIDINPTPSQKPPPNKPSGSPSTGERNTKPKQFAFDEKKYSVKKDTRETLRKSQRHIPYEVPKGEAGKLSEGRLKTVEKTLNQFEKQLDLDDTKIRQSRNKVTIVVAQSTANALVFDIFKSVKVSFNVNPLFSSIADALYYKSITPQVNQFVHSIFSGNIGKARSAIGESEANIKQAVETKIKESKQVQSLREEMFAANEKINRATFEYQYKIQEIEKLEKIEAEKIAEIRRAEEAKRQKMAQDALDKSRGWSENKNSSYSIECTCYCGGRLLWTKWVASEIICSALCPTGAPCS